MLYQMPELEPSDREVLAEIEAMRDRLRLHLRAPHRWEGQFRRNLVARAIAGSNTIEGYAASVEDVEDMIAGEAPVDASEPVAAEIEGYRQAMSYIQRLGSAGDDFSYSKGLLNALHFMMQGHHVGQRPGWWRTGPVYVTSPDVPGGIAYTAPDADDVPGLTGELIGWLNEGDLDAPALIRAAMAHLNLVSIHPWRDGNGRMSRALQTLVLAREGVMAPEFSSIEEWLGRARNTYRYYDALSVQGETWEPERDTLPWVKFCLRAHHLQAQSVELRVIRTREVWSALEEAMEARGWPERMMDALYPVAMGHRTRRAVYEQDAALSVQQARRDLRDLVGAQWLEAKGEAQTRYYVAGPAFPDKIRQAATAPRTIRDPYADRVLSRSAVASQGGLTIQDGLTVMSPRSECAVITWRVDAAWRTLTLDTPTMASALTWYAAEPGTPIVTDPTSVDAWTDAGGAVNVALMPPASDFSAAERPESPVALIRPVEVWAVTGPDSEVSVTEPPWPSTCTAVPRGTVTS